jgi:hypothetical protein
MVAGFAEVIEIEETLVAAACNHPNCLVLPFSFPMVRLAACGASLDSRNEKEYVIHRNRL